MSLKILEEYQNDKESAAIEYRKSVKTIIIITSVVLGGPLVAKLLMAYPLKDFTSSILPASAANYLDSTGITEKFNVDDLRYAIFLVFLLCLNFIPLYIFIKKDKIYNPKKVIPVVSVICCISFMSYFVNESNIFDHQYEDKYRGMDTAVSSEVSYSCRTQYNYSIANYPMVVNTPGTSVFHSFKSNSTAAFCDLVGYENTFHASSRGFFNSPAIQTLLSIKTVVDSSGKSAPAKYYVPFGYVYDYYIPDDGFEYSTDIETNNKRIELMTKACVANDETALIISNVAKEYNSQNDINLDETRNRNKLTAAKDFVITSTGFSCVSTGKKDRIVYFSIPNDNGWTAYIDGEETEILTVNGGMMGIIVPAGKSAICFEFKTPGLIPGIIISGLSLIVLFCYSVVRVRKRKQ